MLNQAHLTSLFHQSSWVSWFNLPGVSGSIFLGFLVQSFWVSWFNLPMFLVQSSWGFWFNLPGVPGSILLGFLVQSSWVSWFNLPGVPGSIFLGFLVNLPGFPGSILLGFPGSIFLGFLFQSSWVSWFNLPGVPGSICLGFLQVQSFWGFLVQSFWGSYRFNLFGVPGSIYLGFVDQSENSPLEHVSLWSILAFEPVYFKFGIIVPLVLYFSFSDFRINLEFIILLESKFYWWFQVLIPADAELKNKNILIPPQGVVEPCFHACCKFLIPPILCDTKRTYWA